MERTPSPSVPTSLPPGPLMVVGAHAFDAEAMAGGLAATWARSGHKVVLVHVSLGEAGHAGKPKDEYAQQKQQEIAAAAAALGAQAIVLGHPDAAVGETADLALEVAAAVQEQCPASVVTHWRGSWHPDHVATYHAVLKSLVLAGLGKASLDRDPHSPQLLMFGENWEDTDDFRPQAYYDITDGFDRWQASLAAYEIGGDNPPGFPYRDYYTAMARARGCLYGVRYAEAFYPAAPEVAAGLCARAWHQAT